MTKNPPWQRDELILALDLFFRAGCKALDPSNEDVVALSNLLNSLPIHGERKSNDRYRNANGVGMKLSNFLRFSPNYEGKGLQNGGKLEKVIWDEFSDNPSYLHQVALSIAAGVSGNDSEKAYVPADEDEIAFPEGKLLYRQHITRERNRQLIEQVKQNAILNGTLFCSICGFDFNKTYGDIGAGFIECHHTVPVSEYAEQKATKPADIALVCSNCHAMLHRRRPWLTINELNKILTSNKRN